MSPHPDPVEVRFSAAQARGLPEQSSRPGPERVAAGRHRLPIDCRGRTPLAPVCAFSLLTAAQSVAAGNQTSYPSSYIRNAWSTLCKGALRLSCYTRSLDDVMPRGASWRVDARATASREAAAASTTPYGPLGGRPTGTRCAASSISAASSIRAGCTSVRYCRAISSSCRCNAASAAMYRAY
jgi:hypothetical protein